MKRVKKVIVCRVCNSKSTHIYSTVKLPECIWPTKKKTKFSECHVYSCLKCNHLQLQNFSKKKISTFYGENQCNTDTSLVNKKRLKLIEKIYGKNYLKNKKILDVGGGINPIIKNKNVFIADIKIQKMNKLIFKDRFYNVDIEEKKINKIFDIIFLVHTLEHFKFPKKAILNIKNSLSVNGKLFIEIPNLNYMTKHKTYYSIFHQHLSMFSKKHLCNLLSQSGLQIDKLLNENGVIFCSVKKTNLKNNKLIKINNIKIFKSFKKNYILMKKKLIKHLKKNKFDIYGAGGSMALAISTISNHKNNINQIYDNDPAKLNHKFPGTKKKIIGAKKNNSFGNYLSISNYDLKKKE